MSDLIVTYPTRFSDATEVSEDDVIGYNACLCLPKAELNNKYKTFLFGV